MLQMMKSKLKDILRPSYNRLKASRIARYDLGIFLKGYSPNIRNASIENLNSHLIIHAHALEKSLSRSNFAPKRGETALIKLRLVMDEYRRLGYDEGHYAFQVALSSIAALSRQYNDAGYDIRFLQKHLGVWAESHSAKNIAGGAITFTAKSKEGNAKKTFAETIQDRYSVREYSGDPVDASELKAAIQLAQKSPSVCNRQAAHTYVITDAQIIESVLKIHTGFRGYATPQALLLVAGDNRRFLEAKEFGQANIDGGLFAMSLLLSLEYYGLAACPLNAMFDILDEKKIREIIGVSESETLIMFVAVGHFKKKNLAAMSCRYPTDDVITIVGNE